MSPPLAHADALPAAIPAPAPWIGHMDATTASIRAFNQGLRDGQQLTYGIHKPTLGGIFTGNMYLRGIAFGMADNCPTGSAGIYNRGIMRDRLFSLPPSPWLPPAILPVPHQPATAPPRHENPILHRFSATPLPHIPLPENVVRESLTLAWNREQLSLLFDFAQPGCWIAPECYTTFPVSTAATTRAVESTCLVWRPGNTPLRAIQPDSMRARCMGVIFATGEEDLVNTLVASKYICTPWMNMIVFPNRPRNSTFVCTFESLSSALNDYEEVHWNIRAALDDSVDAANFCIERGKDPKAIFSSIELEYAHANGRHLWNISTSMPGQEKYEINLWRKIVSSLQPRDGTSTTMTAVHTECEVCGC